MTLIPAPVMVAGHLSAPAGFGAPTSLEAGTGSGTSITTGSFAPTDGALVVAFVMFGDDIAIPAAPAISGGGVTTWTLHQVARASSSSTRASFMYVAQEATYGAAAAASITYGGQDMGGVIWSFAEWTDAFDATADNGVSALLQVEDIDTQANTTGTDVDLCDFADTDNLCLLCSVYGDDVTITPNSPLTQLTEGSLATSATMEVAYNLGEVLTPGSTHDGSAISPAMFGVEVRGTGTTIDNAITVDTIATAQTRTTASVTFDSGKDYLVIAISRRNNGAAHTHDTVVSLAGGSFTKVTSADVFWDDVGSGETARMSVWTAAGSALTDGQVQLTSSIGANNYALILVEVDGVGSYSTLDTDAQTDPVSFTNAGSAPAATSATLVAVGGSNVSAAPTVDSFTAGWKPVGGDTGDRLFTRAGVVAANGYISTSGREAFSIDTDQAVDFGIILLELTAA